LQYIHLSMRPTDGIPLPLRDDYKIPSLMEFFPHRGDCNIHPSIRLADGLFPTQRRLQYPSIHTPRWWDFPYENPLLMRFPPLEGSYDIHPSIHMPRWWDFPHLEVKTWFLCCWDFPHLEDHVCTLCWWDFPHSEVSMQTCIWAFLGSPTGVKILRYGLPPLRISHNVERFSPLRALIKCSINGIAPTRSTKTSLQASIVWTFGQKSFW